MTPDQNARIDAGVADCLNHCNDPTRLFTLVSSFVKRLKTSQEWTDAELSELQIRVIRILLQRHDEGTGPSKAKLKHKPH